MSKIFTCENPGCERTFSRFPKDISLHNYCSRSCAVTVNNKKFPKRTAPLKICRNVQCKKQYKKDGEYFCSFHCRGEAQRKYSRDELLNLIKEKCMTLGRVPTKRECPEIFSACVNTFGFWNNAIRAAGFEPYRSHDDRMYKRMRTKALDGHVCDSVSEAIIDNWLTEHGIAHERDVIYGATNYKADWQLSNGTLVEYFGLAKDSPRYDRAVRAKQTLAKEHNLSLIEIYPNDLYPQVPLSHIFSS